MLASPACGEGLREQLGTGRSVLARYHSVGRSRTSLYCQILHGARERDPDDVLKGEDEQFSLLTVFHYANSEILGEKLFYWAG